MNYWCSVKSISQINICVQLFLFILFKISFQQANSLNEFESFIIKIKIVHTKDEKKIVNIIITRIIFIYVIELCCTFKYWPWILGYRKNIQFFLRLNFRISFGQFVFVAKLHANIFIMKTNIGDFLSETILFQHLSLNAAIEMTPKECFGNSASNSIF